MLRQLSLVWLLTTCFTAVAIAAEPLIWVEAEAAAKRQLVDNAGLNDVNPDALSGGKWICSFSHEKDPASMGEYALEIPTAGAITSGCGPWAARAWPIAWTARKAL